MNNIEKVMKSAETIIMHWKPTKITFGEGSINRVGEIVKKYSERALIIIGKSSIRASGVFDRITDQLRKDGVTYRICEGVEPNPSKETVYRIAYHLLAGNFSCLLAIGGGSVIDAAKAAGILGAVRKGELDDYFGVGMISKKVKKTIDLIAVPTTSGTGSEVTKFSVITDTILHVKKLIFDPAIVATEAIVDPELTYSCGQHVTQVSGLDTMTHLIEGYLNTVDERADPEANNRALNGMKLLFDALPRVVRDGADRQARKRMSAASILGGSVLFYKQAGGPHLNSFSWCNVMEHGEACAVMLPYYTAYYSPVVTEKLKTLAEIFAIDNPSNIGKDFAEGLMKFYRRLSFPTKLKEFKGFSKDLINKAIVDASQNKMKLDALPRSIPAGRSEEILKTIIEGAYNGSIDEILRL